MMAEDYYSLLGVSRSASEDELKSAYRKLARALHPDANGGDPQAEARFKEVTVAYETLRDPERRRRYDMFGPEGIQGPPGGMDPGAFFGGGLGGLFDAFFGSPSGRSNRRTGPMRGSDAEVVLRLEFEEAVFGARRDVVVRELVRCEECGGSGARAGTTATRCPDCGGSGEVRRVRQSILGQVVTASTCPRCRGTGEVIASPCPVCRGEGRVEEDRTFTVEVPAGVEDGTTLRLNGRGPSGLRGGPPGDLFVHLSVAPHERFERAGDDLETTVHVAMTQAALGTALVVELLDGAESLVIPPGSQTGQTFRFKGHGVPRLGGRGRGDVIVHLVVDTPTELTRSQETLLRQLAEERSEPVNEHSEGIFSRLRSALS